MDTKTMKTIKYCKCDNPRTAIHTKEGRICADCGKSVDLPETKTMKHAPKESKRERIKDAVRNVLERNGISRDAAYDYACEIADELEGEI